MNVFHFLECSVRQVSHRRWYLHQFGVRRYLRAEVTNQLKYICLEVIYRSDKIVILLGLFIWRTLQTRLHVSNCIDQLGITVEFLYFFFTTVSLCTLHVSIDRDHFRSEFAFERPALFAMTGYSINKWPDEKTCALSNCVVLSSYYKCLRDIVCSVPT